MYADINNIIEEYKGKTVFELRDILNESSTSNRVLYVNLSRKMLGQLNNKSNNRINIDKTSIIMKTVRIKANGKLAQSMSFIPVDFDEWTEDKGFKESYLYNYFNNNYFAFFIFQEFTSEKIISEKNIVFKDIAIWKMEEYDLNHGLKDIWIYVRELIKNNKLIITQKKLSNGKYINKNNLPSSKFNYLGHLRPGAKDGKDIEVLPTGQKLVKQKFWFNKSYIEEIIGL